MKAKRMVAAPAAVSLISLGLAACSATGPTKPAGKTAITVEDYFVPPGDPEVDKIYASCAVTTNTKLTVDHVAGAGLDREGASAGLVEDPPGCPHARQPGCAADRGIGCACPDH